MAKKMNVAYLRVSTDAQTEKYGLDVQKDKILEYCTKNEIVIDKWYIDGGFSGSTLDRPKIQELLSDAEAGIVGTVFIYKLDRMSRDASDTLDLLCKTLPKYDAKVESMTEEIVTNTPDGRMLLGVRASINQYEREVIYMRTRAGMLERVKRGLWMGGGTIPFGYYYDRNDGILHINEPQAELVREAYRMYIDGYSCNSIAKLLGFKGDRIVMQILQRKSNLGKIVYKGVEYEGKHEAIIDEETFYKTQECIKRRSNKSYVVRDNLLTGLCYCGVCGARMRYQKWGKYHKLICYSQQASTKDYMVRDRNCDNLKVRADEIEREVEEHFKRFIINVDNGIKKDSNLHIINAQIEKSKKKLKNLYHLYAEQGNDTLLEVIEEEENYLRELEKKIADEKENEIADAHRNEEIKSIRQIADGWELLSIEEKNKILKRCVEKIVITNGDIEIYFVF